MKIRGCKGRILGRKVSMLRKELHIQSGEDTTWLGRQIPTMLWRDLYLIRGAGGTTRPLSRAP